MTTTPAAKRTRLQVFQGGALIVLGIALFVSFFVNHRADSQQVRCLRALATDRSGAAVQRSHAVELESDAFRQIVVDVFAAKTPAQAKVAKARFDRRLRVVDRIRDQNPARPFPAGACQ